MSGILQVLIGLIVGGAGAAVWQAPQARTMVEPYLAANTDAIAFGGVIAGGLWIVFGVLTMIFGAIFGGGGGRELSTGDVRQQLNKFHELMTGLVVRMVGADGRIDPAEMQMVQGILQKHGQTPIPEKTIASIAKSAAEDPTRYLKIVQEESDVLTGEQKEAILRACMLVATADIMLDDGEMQYLHQIGQALALQPEQVEAVRADISNVAQRLMGAASAVA